MRLSRRLFSLVTGLFGFGYPPAMASDVAVIDALHKAVQRGDVAGARKLLTADRSLARSRDKYGFEPIHLMDVSFSPQMLDLLLTHGADVNTRNDKGVTALHILAEPEAVAFLKSAGADIDARDHAGNTPLILMAGERDREDVMQALIQAGANVRHTNKRGETALSVAKSREESEKVRLLLRAGAH